MSEFVKVAAVVDIPPGERFFYEFEEETVIVFNVNGTYFCIADLCSHDDGPLGDGDLEGLEVECPRHGARFNIRSGKALCLPATQSIPVYEVKIENDDIYVQSPDDW